MRSRHFARKSRCGSRSTRLQEREVAALIGAKNFLGIKPGIAALRLISRRLGGGGAALEFRIIDHEIDAAVLDRKPDAVAVAHQAERATGSACLLYTSDAADDLTRV